MQPLPCQVSASLCDDAPADLRPAAPHPVRGLHALPLHLLRGRPVPEPPAGALTLRPAHRAAGRVPPRHAARAEHGRRAGRAPRVGGGEVDIAPALDVHILEGSHVRRQSGRARYEGVVGEPHAGAGAGLLPARRALLARELANRPILHIKSNEKSSKLAFLPYPARCRARPC